jgi:hypothetical protein
LWNATQVLMGLRYSKEKVDSIIKEGFSRTFDDPRT